MCSALDPTNKNSYTRAALRAMDPTSGSNLGAAVGVLTGTGALTVTGGAVYNLYKHLTGKEPVADDNLKRQVMAESQPPPTPFDVISADARTMKRRYAKSLGFSPYFLRQ